MGLVDKIQSIRGMNDLLPEQSGSWQYIETILRQLMASYNYQEIRFPIVEKTALFKRSIGEVTDIVEKEMYTFEDRNGDSLTLRPEGTAVCVRAGIQNGILANQQQRLWYMGPMFRHERPQKGRYRQFHQFGVETYGIAGPDIDAELICMTARFWQILGLGRDVELQINSLGSNQARADYRQVLVDYLSQYKDKLDEDSLRRLETNPLRILDSKNPDLQEIIENAPQLADCLDDESREDFAKLKAYLDSVGIAYVVNPRLVRGLDYYNKLVFEWVTDKLGSQGTICAGGRYDGLVEQLGGKPTPAVGFAMGMERLIALVSEDKGIRGENPHAVLLTMGDNAQSQAMALAERLRFEVHGLRLSTLCGGGSFKSQMKRADKSQAHVALILADDEIANESLTIKYLRRDENDGQSGSQSQQTLPLEQVIAILGVLANESSLDL